MAIAINGSGTITGISAGGLPDGVITTDDIAAAAVTQAKRSEQLTLGTAKASTSGTSIDFSPADGTGIPSWVKRITVMFDGVSLSGTSAFLIQLGDSGGVETTGYSGGGGRFSTTGYVGTNFTAGFGLNNTTAAALYSGIIIIANITSNTWSMQGTLGASATETLAITAGSKTLSGTLDRIRVTTVNGTDTFDAGSINILYE
jgi:hypothetical protein